MRVHEDIQSIPESVTLFISHYLSNVKHIRNLHVFELHLEINLRVIHNQNTYMSTSRQCNFEQNIKNPKRISYFKISFRMISFFNTCYLILNSLLQKQKLFHPNDFYFH